MTSAQPSQPDKSAEPVLSDQRQILEVHANIKNAPPLVVGKFSFNVFKLTVIYRRYATFEPWEFIHISVNGTWLDGGQQGKVGHRKYGRGSCDSLPHWLNQFIVNNTPGK